MLELKQEHLEQIHRQAAEQYPHECCGVMVGQSAGDRKAVSELIPATNQRVDSLRNRYLIDPAVIARLERQLRGSGKMILGYFHSHPDAPARPSKYDQEHAWPWYSYLIVSVTRGQPVATSVWQLSPDRSSFEQETFEVSSVEVS